MQKNARVLTLKQPWAWAVIHGAPGTENGVKDVENRSWNTRYRGLLLIHAGKGTDPAGFDKLEELGIGRPSDVDLEYGSIIGSVTLVDIVRGHTSPWAQPFEWHWLMSDPTPAVRLLDFRGNSSLMPAPPDWERAFTPDDPPGYAGPSRLRRAWRDILEGHHPETARVE